MSDDEEEEANVQLTEEFVESVKSWVTFDDKIRSLTAEISELKKEKKPFEEYILENMDKMNLKVMNITGGKLRKNSSNTKTPLNQEHIQNCIYEMTKDSAKAIQISKMIMDKRPIKERVNLKRTTNKKEKKK